MSRRRQRASGEVAVSYLPKEASSYEEAIQVYFTEITARVAVFGARDRQLLRRWKEEGRPARLVCQGIKEAMAAFDERPRSLWQCRGFVDALWDEARERAVGGHREAYSEASKASGSGDKEEGATMAQVLKEAIERAGKESDEERFRKAYREAWRRLGRVASDGQPMGFEQVEAVDAALVEAYLGALSEQEREALEASLRDQHAGYLGAMSPRARRQHLQVQRKRALVEDYGLIDLVQEIE